MRIVVAHNRYRLTGGEDSAVANEVAMLRRAGHGVEMLEADNRAIEGPVAAFAAAGALFYSAQSRRKMDSMLCEFRPDVVHVHNWFPLLSPSVHRAAAEAGVPVVQTLHNFRMVCANSALYREGRVCHDCLGKTLPIAPTIHGCYRGSRAGSAAVTAAFAYHRAAGTWDAVTVFVALSEFQREMLVRGGMDAGRIVVKSNFVRNVRAGEGRGGYALFAGRLTAEKGIRTVLRAWGLDPKLPPLKIFGDGPLANEVVEHAARLAHVEYLGQRSREEITEAMGAALYLVFPSECYEALPMAVLEAYVRGTPVVAAEMPSLKDLVCEGETGTCFAAGDADDLVAKALEMMADGPRYAAMRANCRREYERKYSEEINCAQLTGIYGAAIAEQRRRTLAGDPLAETCA